MVYPSHQLLSVLTFEEVVVGAFDTKIVAFLFVGHAEHEAGKFLIRMVAADFLFGDDAAFIDTAVKDDELLHLAQLRLRDVQGNSVMAVLFGLAFGKEGFPLSGVSFREETGHLAAERVDVFGKENRINSFIVEENIVKWNGNSHQLAVGREDVAARSLQGPDTIFALLGTFEQLFVVLGLHEDNLRDDGDTEDKNEDINQIGLQ